MVVRSGLCDQAAPVRVETALMTSYANETSVFTFVPQLFYLQHGTRDSNPRDIVISTNKVITAMCFCLLCAWFHAMHIMCINSFHHLNNFRT